MDGFGCDGGVIAESVGGLRFGPRIAGRVEAGFGLGREGFEELLRASVQPLIRPVDAVAFVGDAVRHGSDSERIGGRTRNCGATAMPIG